MTKEQIKNKLRVDEALLSLETEQKASWQFMLVDSNLSQIQFFKDDGNGFAIAADKPSDFPTDSVINARLTAMHNLVDAGKTLEEVLTNTSW